MDWYFKEHGDSIALKVLNRTIPKINKNNFDGMLPAEIKFIKDMEQFLNDEKYYKFFENGNITFETGFHLRQLIKKIDDNGKEKYRQIYRTFLREYTVQTNVYSNNGLIRVILDGRLDDYLSEMESYRVDFALSVQKKIFNWISKQELIIDGHQKDGLLPKDVDKNYYLSGLEKMILGKKKKREDFKSLIIETLKKNLNREQQALEFIKYKLELS